MAEEVIRSRWADAEFEIGRVLSWRYDGFRELGFGREMAAVLAETPEVELERVRSLVAHGCPLPLVLDIVL